MPDKLMSITSFLLSRTNGPSGPFSSASSLRTCHLADQIRSYTMVSLADSPLDTICSMPHYKKRSFLFLFYLSLRLARSSSSADTELSLDTSEAKLLDSKRSK
jgi:hypothetical protein